MPQPEAMKIIYEFFLFFLKCWHFQRSMQAQLTVWICVTPRVDWEEGCSGRKTLHGQCAVQRSIKWSRQKMKFQRASHYCSQACLHRSLHGLLQNRCDGSCWQHQIIATTFLSGKLRNMEQLWITVFKWYVLLEIAHWLKHTLWTITLSGVRKVLKGFWGNQYLK